MKKARIITVFFALALILVVFLYFNSKTSGLSESFQQLQNQAQEVQTKTQFKNDSIALVLTEGYGQASEQGRFLDSVSNDLEEYLILLKESMVQSVEKDGFEAYESSGFLDALFFESATISSGGHEFIGRIDVYRMAVSEHFKQEFPELIEQMEIDFSTAPVLDNEGRQQNWLPYHFKGFPLVATMNKITQMQADVQSTRLKLFSALVNSEE